MKSLIRKIFHAIFAVLIFSIVMAFSVPDIPAQAGPPNPLPDIKYYFLPVSFNNYWIQNPQYATGIPDIDAFLETCPQNDPIYAQLTADFQVRVDGVLVTDIPCSEPVSTMPEEQKTYELRTLQAFRVAYYLDPKVPGYLPWTSKNLYDWFKGNVSGVNFKTTSQSHYCCDRIDGKYYISTYFSQGNHVIGDLSWWMVHGALNFFAHEARHRDPDDPKHVEGCEAFPIGSGVYGCDSQYNEDNLGGYGVARWMNWAFAGGYLNIGIACSPKAWWYINDHVSVANGFRKRFVTDIPAELPMPPEPYGGECLAPP